MDFSNRILCWPATLFFVLLVAGPALGVDFVVRPTVVQGYISNPNYGPAPGECGTPPCIQAPCCDVDPKSINRNLDRSWQARADAAYPGLVSRAEFDFDGTEPGLTLCEGDRDLQVDGDLWVDIDLGDGHGECPSLFGGYWINGGGPLYGTVSGNALEAFDGQGHSQMIFYFERPVAGLGMWVFDDADDTPNGTKLTVWEVDGKHRTSGLLDSGNGLGHVIEGFVGAVSRKGIIKATLENFSLSGRPNPTYCCLEIDHLQIAYLPVRMQLVQQLMADVSMLNLRRETEISLLAFLEAALKSIVEGDNAAATSHLKGFIKEAQSQIPVISPLITAAEAIIDLLPS